MANDYGSTNNSKALSSSYYL